MILGHLQVTEVGRVIGVWLLRKNGYIHIKLMGQSHPIYLIMMTLLTERIHHRYQNIDLYLCNAVL